MDAQVCDAREKGDQTITDVDDNGCRTLGLSFTLGVVAVYWLCYRTIFSFSILG